MTVLSAAAMRAFSRLAAGGTLLSKEAGVRDAAKRGYEAVERGVGEVGGSILGAPFRGVGDAVTSALVGRKVTSGPMAGRRVVPIKGGPGKGLEEISAAEYAQIVRGEKPGKAIPGVVGDKAVFYKQRYSKGGLVGLAQRNPGTTAALGGLAYLLGTNQAARSAAGMMMPTPSGPMNPLTPGAKSYMEYQPSGANPMEDTWG